MSQLRALFEQVCELPEPQWRQVLQDSGADADTQARVLALLQADAANHSLAHRPLAQLAARFIETELHSGDQLGAWRLIRELGHGGMGTVFLAERADGHFNQQAALKLIRGHADARTAQRFATERQLLARLQHPQIARLLDGGATPQGQPYLVMEHVEGEPIDHWCRNQHAGLATRLMLFQSICSVVQFAHARMVVHCDLKPSNVLVRADGTPVLLDFGIATRLDTALTSSLSAPRHTTADSAGAGPPTPLTPRYASPEQLRGELPGLPTDIYALGLLLYELCADQPPERGPEQSLRPSATTQPVPWRRQLRGDLDAIVAMACAQDPAARYGSASDLAADVARIATHQPVAARLPDNGYRLAKLLRRRWPLLLAATTALVLATAFTWLTVLAERKARVEARTAEHVIEFLISAFALSDPSRSDRHDYSAREVLERGAERIRDELNHEPRVKLRLLEALGHAFAGINEGSAGAPLLDEAARLALQPSMQQPLLAARALGGKTHALLDARLSTHEAEAAARQSLQLIRQHGDDDPLLLAGALSTLARALIAQGSPPQEALDAAQLALQLRQSALAPAPLVAESLTNLCHIISNMGDRATALPYCERALSLYQSAGQTRSDAYRTALRNQMGTLQYLGRPHDSLQVRRQLLELTRQLYGETSSVLAVDRTTYAEALFDLGAFEQAEQVLQLAEPVILQRNGPHSAQHARALFTRGWMYYQQGRFAAGIPLLRDAVNVQELATGGQDNDRLQVMRTDLAITLIAAGRAGTEARAQLDRVMAARKAADADNNDLAYVRLPLADWLVANGRLAEAETLLLQIEELGGRIEAGMHSAVATTRAAIARARGDALTAVEHERIAFELYLGVYDANHPRTARLALTWAQALREAGQLAQADAVQKQYQSVVERAYPKDSAYRALLR